MRVAIWTYYQSMGILTIIIRSTTMFGDSSSLNNSPSLSLLSHTIVYNYL